MCVSPRPLLVERLPWLLLKLLLLLLVLVVVLPGRDMERSVVWDACCTEVPAEPAVRRPASGAVRGREAAAVEVEEVVARYVPEVGAARRDGGGDWRRVSSVSLMVLERPPGVGVGCAGGGGSGGR